MNTAQHGQDGADAHEEGQQQRMENPQEYLTPERAHASSQRGGSKLQNEESPTGRAHNEQSIDKKRAAGNRSEARSVRASAKRSEKMINEFSTPTPSAYQIKWNGKKTTAILLKQELENEHEARQKPARQSRLQKGRSSSLKPELAKRQSQETEVDEAAALGGYTNPTKASSKNKDLRGVISKERMTSGLAERPLQERGSHLAQLLNKRTVIITSNAPANQEQEELERSGGRLRHE